MTPASNMPAAEVDIDASLVRRLVASQFPPWAGLAVEQVTSGGWDNAIYRLGPDLVVRLPRRRMSAELVQKEQRWLPELAPRLPLPVPVPIGRGAPEEGYPWHWSICRWLPGEMAATASIEDLESLAATLGAFMAALHTVGPPDGPRSPWRGVPLMERDESVRGVLRQMGDSVDQAAVGAAWADALDLPRWTGPDVWLHGDLHPANMVVETGRLSAVIDFGDLAVGDPATDLMSAWMLLPASARPMLRDAVGVDDATWYRGRGWALCWGLMALARSADNPVTSALGRRAVAEVLAERQGP
ncbi:MAG: aminoglycoside phosphotransferase family protein [Acidimicrobiales bacterium]